MPIFPPRAFRSKASGQDRAWPALDCLPAAVLMLDADLQIEFANPAARSLLGETARPDVQGSETAQDAGWLTPAAATAAVSSQTPIRLHLTDGRYLDCGVRRRPEGGYAAVLSDVSALVRGVEAAARDGLTGLHGRAAFEDRLAEAMASSARLGQQPAVIAIDLDRFKAVNDTLGHPIGDALLRKVAERLKNAAREGDVVARLGGDEFAVIQTGGDQPLAAQALSDRLVDLLGRTYVADGHMLNIGASVGVAISPGDGADPGVLLKNADLALYKAKADGRGVVRFFESGLDRRMQARRSLELDLRRALAAKELTLDYQPQIRLSTDEVTGFEALLRWRHAERGLVAPADFIPLAEEIGLIQPIGEWVIRTACATAASWPDDLLIAVNLSPVQFRSGKLLQTVSSALAHSGLAPSRLELEITEGALLENTDAVLHTLRGLKALGVRISMDDFGTGYSSLSYLQKFPFDKIKIDRSFIRRLGEDPDCAAIVRAVIGLGASLGMETLAEGVETPEQLAHMRAEGCKGVQGYLTGRPLPEDEAAELISNRILRRVPT
jgi:diguanylate cyclase (GGDEF)-like protein